MGALLRRYWHPVGCSEFVTSKPQRVKVLGEELVLYRGASGTPALMQLRCAHRSLALDYGRVEGDSIRCAYHGWLYDQTGQCLAQPAEPEGSSFKEKIRLKSYQVQEVSGLVFGYMGPEPGAAAAALRRAAHGGRGQGSPGAERSTPTGSITSRTSSISATWLGCTAIPSRPMARRKVTYHWERTDFGANNVMLDRRHR